LVAGLGNRFISADSIGPRAADKIAVTGHMANSDSRELFELIGKKRGFLISGGEIDYARTAVMLLDEFRGAKIGRLTLEEPPKKE